MEENYIVAGSRSGGAVVVGAVVFGLVAVALAPGVFAAGTVSVSQTPGEVTADPGERITLTTTLTVSGDLYAPGADATLPDSWNVTDQTSSGTYRASDHQWTWLRKGTKTVEYTVSVPTDAAAGTYEIGMEGSAVRENESIVTDTTTTTVVVGTQRPVGRVAVTPQSPTVGESTTLNASTSVDPDGTIERYEWDLDDDGTFEQAGATVTTTFDAAGETAITLRVTDTDGAVNTTTQALTVQQNGDDGSTTGGGGGATGGGGGGATGGGGGGSDTGDDGEDTGDEETGSSDDGDGGDTGDEETGSGDDGDDGGDTGDEETGSSDDGDGGEGDSSVDEGEDDDSDETTETGTQTESTGAGGTDTENATGSQTGTGTAQGTTGGDGPGFTAVGAVLALVLGHLLVNRE